MSYPPKVRKDFTSKSKSKSESSSSSSSNSSGSKMESISGKKAVQILSSTANSSLGPSTSAELMCDVSDIEKPHIKNQSQCTESKDKEAKKAVLKLKALSTAEKVEVAYATYVQKMFLCSLQAKKITSETENCFSDLEAVKLKIDNEISTVNKCLKEVSSSQESEARIEELENIFMEIEGDMCQLQTMLKKVNLDMKIANGQVPLTVLKVKDASRDEFLSVIQELSNICNEIISIMKSHENSQKDAAQIIEACLSTVMQLRSLINDCCCTLPSVVSSYFRALSVESCLMHQDKDFQLNKIGFQLDTSGPSLGNGQ